MNGKTYIGIDPGKNGFISAYNEEVGFKFYPIPLINKELDIQALDRYFTLIKSDFDINDFDDDSYCVIEDVHAKFGAAAGATFEFGYVCGILEGIVVARRIPYTKVAPKKWQKQMWEGVPLIQKPSSTGKTQVNDTKAMSLMAAKRMFPGIDLRENERCKKPHDGKIDSLLLCEYCKRNFR